MINLDNHRSGFVSEHCMYKDNVESKITDFENYYSQNGEDGVLEKIFEVYVLVCARVEYIYHI